MQNGHNGRQQGEREREKMFADLEGRREEHISKLQAKHPKQNRETAENALDEATAYFCFFENKHLITNGHIAGLVFQRADWQLTHDWRREKKHTPLDGNREKTWIDEALLERRLDIEKFLVTQQETKRDIFRLWHDGYSYAEIAQKLGMKNTSTLRMRILRIIEDLRKFMK